MDYVLTIKYSTDSAQARHDEGVNTSILAVLDNTLPYMVNNVDILLDLDA